MAGSGLHKTTVVERSYLTETCSITRIENGEDRSMDDRPTVVFADDNYKVTEIACALLSPAYEVVKVAVDGEEAIQSICELRPDFAVLDISMPKMDGIRVARQLHQARMSTLVVFVTLIDDEDYIQEAKLVGHGYVLKRRLSFDLLRALAFAREGLFFCSH
jgi:DNA-binding NarL/FixJ family response regulator